MKRILSILACASLLPGYSATAEPPSAPSYKPAKGYVPDAKTAIQIAVAVWSPIYGARKIQGEKPFHATLSHGVWTVIGSLPQHKPGQLLHGGVAMARIARADGRILQVIHGK